MCFLSAHARGRGGSVLQAGADVMAVDGNKQTAVHHAARSGADAYGIAGLLSAWQQAATADGTALDSGATCGAVGALDVWGRTPLHWAVVNGHRDAVVTLLEAGSDQGLEDLQNESPLAIAKRRAICREWINGQDGGQCDKFTLSLFNLI